MPARVFRSLAAARRWRSSFAGTADALSVVAGSFRILHPGNLRCIAAAAAKHPRLCLAVEPGRGGALDNTGLLRLLRGVEAVAVVRREEMPRLFGALRPYTLFDCVAQQNPSDANMAARAAARRIEPVAPLKGFFTRDVLAAISGSRLPLTVAGRRRRESPVERLRRTAGGMQGMKIATVNGSFDVLHAGHARLLERARKMGGALVVLVNDDASVRRHKGPRRPVFGIGIRLAALESLEPVTAAIPFSGDNPLNALRRLRPAVHVKGGSFVPERVRMEKKLLASWGGRVIFVPMYKQHSTTGVIGALSGRA